MAIPFWKMHGAGNDFILVDDRSGGFPANEPAFRAGLCDRRRGIGSDGLLLIQPSSAADFRMRFFNPDGS
ncbi:MAG TPA: diaminopimelate epimerase, partial [Kiritimatiellia bacterium]|nr:diaminopimelate epimerase [Kiritimatiellia bacterium]